MPTSWFLADQWQGQILIREAQNLNMDMKYNATPPKMRILNYILSQFIPAGDFDSIQETAAFHSSYSSILQWICICWVTP